MTAVKMDIKDYDPLRYFASVFLLTSVAGLCAILRAGKIPEKSRIVACTVTSGLMGMAFAMFGAEYYPNLPLSFTAIAILAGIGGMTTVDFTLTVSKNVLLAILNIKLDRVKKD